jgi:hypothetical protein
MHERVSETGDCALGFSAFDFIMIDVHCRGLNIIEF